MSKYLKASSWNRLRDIRPEAEEQPKAAQPKAPTPNHLIAVTAQGTRLVSTR
jgi:hypothetical protein